MRRNVRKITGITFLDKYKWIWLRTSEKELERFLWLNDGVEDLFNFTGPVYE